MCPHCLCILMFMLMFCLCHFSLYQTTLCYNMQVSVWKYIQFALWYILFKVCYFCNKKKKSRILDCWQKALAYPIVRLGGAGTHFLYNSERKKSYTPRLLWGWVIHRLILIFWWTNPISWINKLFLCLFLQWIYIYIYIYIYEGIPSFHSVWHVVLSLQLLFHTICGYIFFVLFS